MAVGGKANSKGQGEAAASGVTDIFQRFNCDYCQEDIPGLRIKCAECTDFDLCLECFSCGAQTGKHKSYHKYMFMSNGDFPLFHESSSSSESRHSKRVVGHDCPVRWTAKEHIKLLDAVEKYGYGNWKDISAHIDSKTPEQAKDEYVKHFINGYIGRCTWAEELRGKEIDHTKPDDCGPLSPTLTSKLPPVSVTSEEALLLGYMPNRDDFEDFDKETESLVSQIKDRHSDDDGIDLLLKLTMCDMYVRKLREQVRRKRVARDYQLVSKFYRKHPIVQVGFGAKVSPKKISKQIKLVQKGEGPKKDFYEALTRFTQFLTAHEFFDFVDTICAAKELKVRITELQRYRENGITKVSDLVPFETERFKRELRNKRNSKLKGLGAYSMSRFLPTYGDYSLNAVLKPFQEETPSLNGIGLKYKKRPKKSLWSRKKEKTGRRLLLQKHSCIITYADKKATLSDSCTE